MIAISRILCPVDFSETSRHAFQYALHFARQCQAALSVLHVVEDAPLLTAYAGLPDLDLRDAMERSARKEMAALVAAAPAELPVRTEIVHGPTYKSILRYAEQGQFDLIVMGTHGRSGLDYAFFGSVAERVIRRAPCPVVIVRHPGGAGDHPEK